MFGYYLRRRKIAPCREKRKAAEMAAELFAGLRISMPAQAELNDERNAGRGEGDDDDRGLRLVFYIDLVAHHQRGGGRLKRDAAFRYGRPGLAGNHVRDFADRIPHVLLQVLHIVAEHAVDENRRACAGERDGDGSEPVA